MLVRHNTGAITDNVTVTVECARALEQLAPLLEDLGRAHAQVTELSGELGTTTGMLHAALITVGEKDVPPEKRAERVVEIIHRLQQTIAELRSAPRGDAPAHRKARQGPRPRGRGGAGQGGVARSPGPRPAARLDAADEERRALTQRLLGPPEAGLMVAAAGPAVGILL